MRLSSTRCEGEASPTHAETVWRFGEGRARWSGGVVQEEPPLVVLPADDGEAVAALEPARGVELEAAEEGGRLEAARGSERGAGFEFQAAGRDERGGVGLGGDGVVEFDPFGAEVDGGLEVAMPLDGGEEAVGFAAQEVGEGGQTGRDAAEQRSPPEPAEHFHLPLVRPTEEDGVRLRWRRDQLQ